LKYFHVVIEGGFYVCAPSLLEALKQLDEKCKVSDYHHASREIDEHEYKQAIGEE